MIYKNYPIIRISDWTIYEYFGRSRISEDEDISRIYLKQVTSLLVKDNLVESRRGKDGGYKLTADPTEISVGDILRATEESLSTPVYTKCSKAPRRYRLLYKASVG